MSFQQSAIATATLPACSSKGHYTYSHPYNSHFVTLATSTTTWTSLCNRNNHFTSLCNSNSHFISLYNRNSHFTSLCNSLTATSSACVKTGVISAVCNSNCYFTSLFVFIERALHLLSKSETLGLQTNQLSKQVTSTCSPITATSPSRAISSNHSLACATETLISPACMKQVALPACATITATSPRTVWKQQPFHQPE